MTKEEVFKEIYSAWREGLKPTYVLREDWIDQDPAVAHKRALMAVAEYVHGKLHTTGRVAESSEGNLGTEDLLESALETMDQEKYFRASLEIAMALESIRDSKKLDEVYERMTG